ncbi:Type III pantothenate kinase [Alphaproteobacteria bacterium]
MHICIDAGNSQIYCGVYNENAIVAKFRYGSTPNATSDQFGIFFKNILKECVISANKIKKIAIASVVPELNYPLRSACIKYLKLEPHFLAADTQDLIAIKYENKSELGADRLANAIGATELFPQKNLLIIDFGTATTICVVTRNKEYLGGAILPGLKTSARALGIATAKLPVVEIVKPPMVIGKSTVINIQIGLYYGQLGAVKEIINRIKEIDDIGKTPTILATGGFAYLFKMTGLYDVIINDLVLIGLNRFLNTKT